MRNEETITKTSGQPTGLAAAATETAQTERAERLVTGQSTLAEFIGLGRNEMYEIAAQAYQLLNSGRLGEARDIYQGLVAADPYDSVFHCHLGAVQLRMNNPDEAFEQFNLALQYNIANIDAMVGRGEISLSRGNLNEAVADLSKAIELDAEGKRASTIRARAALLALKDKLEKQSSASIRQ